MDSPRHDASQIVVLEYHECVRKRPVMYIGGIDRAGMHHLAFEVLERAAFSREVRRIEIEILEDRVLRISDDGDGTRVELHRSAKRPWLEVEFTTLHGRGRDGMSRAIANALCSRFDVETTRGGSRYHARFERGVTRIATRCLGPTAARGTSITMAIDPAILPEDLGPFDAERFRRRARELAALIPGVEVAVADRRVQPPREDLYRHGRGLADLVDEIAESPRLDRPIVVRTAFEGGEAEVAIQFQAAGQVRTIGFVNGTRVDRGSHAEGVLRAVEGGAPSGVVACIALTLRDPRYESAEKTTLDCPEVASPIEAAVREALSRREG